MFSLFLTTHSLLIRALLDVVFGWILVYTARVAWTQFRIYSLLKHVPGPKAPSWLWGNEWQMHERAPGAYYSEWMQQYGSVVKIKGALGRNVLVISDLRAVTHILGEHVYDFPKPQGVLEWFRLLVGEGLLVAEGKEKHTRQRRSFAPALNQQAIRPLLPTFYAIASQMADTLSSRIDHASNESIEEDFQWWANRFSLDSIGLAGFSYAFNSISGNGNPLATALEALTNSSDNFSSFVMRAFFFTFPSILKIPSEKGRYIHNTREELGKVATRMWNEAKAGGKDEGKTLMSLMIKADNEAGAERMDGNEISAQLRTLVQAGYEPVGCMIAWVLFELAQHPDVQQRVREEVAATPGEPNFDELLEKMPYLDAVLKECLRLHPPVFELTHVASKESIVPLSKPLPWSSSTHLVVPKGTVIHIPVTVLHTDPQICGPDAAEFRPERWLSLNNGKFAEYSLHGKDLFAFSFGPRKCPGRQFAMVEMKALVTILLRQFTLSMVPGKQIEPFLSFVVRARVQGEKKSRVPLLISKIKY